MGARYGKMAAALALIFAIAGIAYAQVVPQPVAGPVIVCAYNTSPPTLSNAQAGMVQCNASGQIVTVSAGTTAITYTDRSGTITSGGTAQTLAAANTARRGFMIQNQSSGNLYFDTLATAVATGQPSIIIPAGALYESPVNGAPTGAISIIGATTGQAFAAREW